MTRPAVLGALSLTLAAALLGAASVGSVAVPLPEAVAVLLGHLGWGPGPTEPKWDAILFLIRLPRVLGAALIGAALATAGAALQGLLRNPMADPGLLGVSSGAGFGAVLSLGLGLAGQSVWFTPLFAVVGALASASVILAFSYRRGRMPVYTLILAGLAVSTFFGAGTSLVLTYVSHDNVARFLFWALGSLAAVRWDTLAVVILPVGAGLAGLLVYGRELNGLLLGEDEARSIGINVRRTRLVLLVLVSVTTAGAVCTTGPVGFVGLLVPPLLRLLIGADNRVLLPASALGGALFLVLCDLVSRVAGGPREISIGIVTALLGAPYFLWLLVRSGREEGSL